ncbi:hypothetical protein CTheo_317 [Ceratobasidium theobromae]|uniref:Uncharacterized protein n=1 Tax=Ceratobasidium theobromae TaxID=1582974 RepID=A0A5N5QX63_9AGAM|nr:hypothetical protein CTheo_317 [Ceratobasidium theobromae]
MHAPTITGRMQEPCKPQVGRLLSAPRGSSPTSCWTRGPSEGKLTLTRRSDVVYFRNTGVPTINGCGYCKWAKEFPPLPGTASPNNSGWPGCCRAPRPEDTHLIDKEHYAAIAAAWDQRALPQSVSTIRSAPSQRRSPIPQFPEKSSGGTIPDPSRTPPLSAAVPRKQDSIGRRERDDSRRYREPERYSSRRQGSHDGLPPAPVRQGSYDTQASRHGTIRAGAGVGSHSRSGSGNDMIPPPTEPLSLSSLTTSLSTLRVSSAMSDSGSESSSTTVRTDSTDYLSDESEEELQRLAVARAIAIERQRVEEAEYESARRGLRDIDVTTPVQWGAGAPAPSVRSTQYLSFGEVAQYSSRRQR